MKSVAWKGDHPITSYYGWRTDPITGIRSFHDGVDVSMPIGTELYATVNGKVRLATTDSYGGKYIQIQTSDGRGHWCLHLSEFKVKAGDMIQKGNLIGLSGNSGHSTGPHTHFGLQSNATVWSSHIDPLPDLQVLAESARFKKGDRIVFTDIQHVRAGSGKKYDIQTKTVAGQKGTIKDNPRVADGYTWYDVQFDGGGSGWCADVGKMEIYTPPVQPPVVPPESTECEKEVIRLQGEIDSLKASKTLLDSKLRESQEERKRLEGLLEAEKIESKELEARYKDLEEKRKRLEGEKNEAVRLLNEYKNGRFVWIVDFLEKLFPKKK